MRQEALLTAAILLLLSPASAMAWGEQPLSFSTGAVNRADIVVKSVRLTDNGDNDGFADPNETVSLYVTLRNSSGADRDGIVITVASTDEAVDCISSPVVAFGALLAGQERESTVPAVFHVANVSRADIFTSLTASFDFQIAGNDFGGTARPQQIVLDLDLNVTGGFFPSTFTEGFEGAGFGAFTSMTLDSNIANLAASNGLRCQYNDPDFANSNSYGNNFCYLGFTTPGDNAYDWHVHGTSAPDGGRAYLGSHSLHWGVHAGAASADTTRLKQLDAIRSNTTINLGWNGVASVLSFKHQVGIADCDYVECSFGFAVDRAIVQVQVANSTGQGMGAWRKIDPYENAYDSQAVDFYTNCMFDPTDDGNNEDDYFDPSDPDRRLGPSSTCAPEFTFSRQGAIFWSDTFDPNNIRHASDGPGLQGSLGPGTWVQTKFDLARYRGRRLRLRFLATSIEVSTAVTMQQALNWNPLEADDGWYIDDIQVTNTLVGAASVVVDPADRSALPACGPVCKSVAPSLLSTPAVTVQADEEITLDASGSAPDQCPGGTLHYRFWKDFDQDGVLDPIRWDYDPVLQEWGPDTSVIDVPDQTKGSTGYAVDVRCSTRPACGSRATVVVSLECNSVSLTPFPEPIVWWSKTHLHFPTYLHDTIRGDLDALRSSGGQFDGTVEGCLTESLATPGLDDATVPGPGQAFYYLVRDETNRPVCTLGSWGTGSPAEVSGAGGDRDADIALDPDACAPPPWVN